MLVASYCRVWMSLSQLFFPLWWVTLRASLRFIDRWKASRDKAECGQNTGETTTLSRSSSLNSRLFRHHWNWMRCPIRCIRLHRRDLLWKRERSTWSVVNHLINKKEKLLHRSLYLVFYRCSFCPFHSLYPLQVISRRRAGWAASGDRYAHIYHI